jgi:hypothetical protein
MSCGRPTCGGVGLIGLQSDAIVKLVPESQLAAETALGRLPGCRAMYHVVK